MAAMMAGVMLAGCGSGRPGLRPPSAGQALDEPVPLAIAKLPLTDDTGRVTDLAAYRGKIVVLTDFLTLCQDVCPLTSANYAQIDRALAAAHLADRVQLVELTVDPHRDTPARLHAYRALFHAPRNWSLLTASPAVVAKIWKFFGVWDQRFPEDKPAGIDWWTGKRLSYDVDHSDVLAFFDSSGHERFILVGVPNTNGVRPPPALYRFLSRLGYKHLNRPDQAAWTVPQALSAISWQLGKKIQNR
jgi:protein SCO1